MLKIKLKKEIFFHLCTSCIFYRSNRSSWNRRGYRLGWGCNCEPWKSTIEIKTASSKK